MTYSPWVKVRLVIIIFMFVPLGGWPHDFRPYSVNAFTNKVTYLDQK